jgi:hypothetical protein
VVVARGYQEGEEASLGRAIVRGVTSWRHDDWSQTKLSHEAVPLKIKLGNLEFVRKFE